MTYFGSLYFTSRDFPAVTGAAETVSGESMYANVGETKNVSVTCDQVADDLTLAVQFETKDKTDVASVADGSIFKSGTSVQFAIPSAATTAERVLRYSIIRTDTGEQIAGGNLFVTYDAESD